MNYYKRALELKKETIANRRYLHEHAETGLHLENTVEFVMKRLTEYGLNPERCGEGVTALLGQGEPGSSASCRYGCASSDRRKRRKFFM